MLAGVVADEPSAAGVAWREVFRGARGRLTAGLLLLEALVAIQQLVIITIMPDVLRDLGMVQLYGLAFTVASLATIATIPIAGRALDRLGARAVLVPILVLFGVGLLVSATAPSMPIFLVGQFLSGAGGGGLYALSLGTVAKTYPDAIRARVLALLASMWILPGLVGPSLGALIASTLGWRWAFAAPYPVLVLAWVLLAPSLDLVPSGEDDGAAGLSLRWPLQLMLGAGSVFVAVTVAAWWALLVVAFGLAVAIPALARIVPAGTFVAAQGIPAAAATAFLLSMGFIAVDAFLTLTLTDVRGLSLGAAGLVVTIATLTWSAGSAWQAGRAERVPLPRLLAYGASAVLVGQLAVASILATATPVWIAFLGWTIVGFGMGVAFPTIPLSAMRVAGKGQEAGELSSVLLMDVLGIATGAGLGGGIIALGRALEAPLSHALAGSFAFGIATLGVLVILARRIPDGRARTADGC
jgi:MFS family permease